MHEFTMRGQVLWLLSVAGFCAASLGHCALRLDENGRDVLATTTPLANEQDPVSRFAVDVPAISLAPYVWKRTGTGPVVDYLG